MTMLRQRIVDLAADRSYPLDAADFREKLGALSDDDLGFVWSELALAAEFCPKRNLRKRLRQIQEYAENEIKERTD